MITNNAKPDDISPSLDQGAYSQLTSGDLHLNFEAWPKSNPREHGLLTKEFSADDPNPGQVYSYKYNKLFGRSGLYEACSRHDSAYSMCIKSSLSQSPVLLQEALKDSVVQKHFTPVMTKKYPEWTPSYCALAGMNCSVPIFHIAQTGYDEGLMEQLVEALGLQAKIVYVGFEDHAKMIWEAFVQKSGALVYDFFPNTHHYGIPTSKLPRVNVDPILDFVSQRFEKLAWPGLANACGGDALAFVRDFELAPGDYEALSTLFDKLNDHQEAACVWLQVREPYSPACVWLQVRGCLCGCSQSPNPNPTTHVTCEILRSNLNQENPSKWKPLVKFPERKSAPFFCMRNSTGPHYNLGSPNPPKP